MKYHLTYSIFYNKNEWHKLIKYFQICIANYDKIIGTYLKLSRIRGPHIEFTTLVEEVNKIDSVRYFSGKIEEFLRKNPSSNKNIESVNHEFFLDFSNNTVHYGIHDYPHYCFSNLEGIPLDKECNSLITELTFSVYEIFGEKTSYGMVEIIIELLTAFHFSSNKDVIWGIQLFQELYAFECKKYEKSDLENKLRVCKMSFDDNKKEIVDYLNSVLIQKTMLPPHELVKFWDNLFEKHPLFKEINKNNNHLTFFLNSFFSNLDFFNSLNIYFFLLHGLKELNSD